MWKGRCSNSCCMTPQARLVFLVAVGVVASLTACSGQEYDGIHVICKARCSIFSDISTFETCMLECRNYIELALSRPRDSSQPPSAFEKLMEKVTNGGAKSGGFLIAKATGDHPAADRRDMRGAFVRIGRQQGDESQGVADGSADVNKRRAGFVRIGRRRATEEFVRIGKSASESGEDSAAETAEVDPSMLEAEKRKNPTAFVRIGKAKSQGNFVRIGRKPTAFVRIGKGSWNNGEAFEDGETNAAREDDDEYARQLRRQAFVRIGK